MNTSDNARSKATEKNLEEAYLRLLLDDPSRQVSVKQLCAEVHVNRATFYAHYDDIYELQGRIEARISSEVIEIFRDRSLGDKRITRDRLKVLIEYVRRNRLFYKAWFLSGRMDYPSIMEALSDKHVDEDGSRFRGIFFRAGVRAVFRDWIERGCIESDEQMLSILLEFYTF